jgi:hypothetical protein
MLLLARAFAILAILVWVRLISIFGIALTFETHSEGQTHYHPGHWPDRDRSINMEERSPLLFLPVRLQGRAGGKN